MESIFDSFRHRRRKFGNSLHDRWSIIPAPPPDSNTGMVFVDLDNLWGHARDNELEYYLDVAIDWITPENTGIDQLLDVHVFTTAVPGFKPRWEVKLADPSRFCVHTYRRNKGEKGYPDDEMYRCAWSLYYAKRYRTGVFISNDKGVAEASALLRVGTNPYNPKKKPPKHPPEFLVFSSFTGKRWEWIEQSEAYDYDNILAAQGVREPVIRPLQL